MSKYDGNPATVSEIVSSTFRGVGQVTRYLQDMEPYYTVAAKSINNVVEAAKSFSVNFYKDYSESFERLRKLIIETEKDLEAFKFIIAKLGYPPNEKMDIATMRTIVTSYREDKELTEAVIDDFMCEYYDAEFITNTGLKWEENHYLKNRIGILRNVIMAHNLGMYGVAVPAMISQFEGLLVKSYCVRGKVDSEILRIILRNLLKSSKVEKYEFDDVILKYYNKNLLANFYHGDKISSVISRHAILHGSDVDFNKEEVSLKAILLFDYISNKMKNISEQDVVTVNQKIRDLRRKRKNQ